MTKLELLDLVHSIRVDIQDRPFVGPDAEVFQMLDELSDGIYGLNIN